MIRNLNQVNFREFGVIVPERGRDSREQLPEAQTLTLTERDIPVYQAACNTRLCGGAGSAVLSVCAGEGEFFHFWLDKPVWVKPGIRFFLTPFRSRATAELIAETPPEQADTIPYTGNLHISQGLRVENLYTFFYQEKEQGFLFSGEAHPMLELTYVDQGELHSVADGLDILLRQGDMVLYGPDQWHMQYADIGVAPRFVTISFDAVGGDLSGLYNRRFPSPQRAVALLQQMLREQERMDAYSNDMILHLLSQVLLTLQREADAPAERLRTSHAVHNENEIIRRAQQYVSVHIRDRLSVPMVARNVNVSPSYLTALFHKHLQISPGEYIRRLKLQESKQMIRENTMNFTEIAAVLQYSTVHHFSRQFKEKFGITPSEYAKSVR